jgi:hypothetical protein
MGHFFSFSEGVQRGVFPLQVQEVVLRFFCVLRALICRGFTPAPHKGMLSP